MEFFDSAYESCRAMFPHVKQLLTAGRVHDSFNATPANATF